MIVLNKIILETLRQKTVPCIHTDARAVDKIRWEDRMRYTVDK
eukprot:COSAG06_NODE_35048_length_465_cov_0.928962_1_plen_42_part_01